MSLSPLNQLIGIINPTLKIKRGKVVSIAGGSMKVATNTETLSVPYVAGYRIGQYVILNADGSLKSKANSGSKTPIYVV